MQDRLSLLYKEEIEKQVKEVEDNIEKQRLTEFDENIPSTNMSFFDRLLHQITRTTASEADYLNDDVFTEIDGSEIPTTVDDNAEIDKNKLTVNSSFMNIIRSFIDALNEEANVIRGVADQHVFLNRRNRNEKSSLPRIDNNRITLF
jgi:ATP phosphoribosyltransferase